MKKIVIILALALVACSKEDALTPSENVGVKSIYTPENETNPDIKSIYNDYGLWVRMDFVKHTDVTIHPLYSDTYVRGVGKIEDSKRTEAIAYTKALMSNVSKEFAKTFFPWEIFYVQSYGVGWNSSPITSVGRSRIVIQWPNTAEGTIPVTDPVNHYYQDSVLVRMVWSHLSQAIMGRFDRPILEFVNAGKAYDNGEAFDKIMEEYYDDYDKEKRDKALNELAAIGGYISGSGSRSFKVDMGQWIALLATESEANITKKYLETSPARKAKYKVVVELMQIFNWDIQAAGNAFRTKFDEYKATL